MVLKLTHLLLALFATCSIAAYKPEPALAINPELLNTIASFYAGRPVTVAFPERKPGAQDGLWGSGGWGGTIIGDQIALGPFQRKALETFLASPRSKKGVAGIAGIATLIHEAIHGRQTPIEGTGFREWGNESQANALGSELVPDMLQRFFGIKIGSPLSRQYDRAGRSLSGYQGAYGGR